MKAFELRREMIEGTEVFTPPAILGNDPEKKSQLTGRRNEDTHLYRPSTDVHCSGNHRDPPKTPLGSLAALLGLLPFR
jgi:hypothetical protein